MVIGDPVAAPVAEPAAVLAGLFFPLLLHPEIVTTAAMRNARIAPADVGFLVMGLRSQWVADGVNLMLYGSCGQGTCANVIQQ